MSTDARFSGLIPELYDEYLVPMFFEPYAKDLAARVGALPRGAILETAAGSGIVTRELVGLSSARHVVATDLNPDMLAVLARQSSSASLTVRQADAQALPFSDAEFDVVVCQLGVMFFPDKPASYREARRVLGPSGRLLFNVWDRLEHNQLSLVVSDAVAEMFSTNPPRFIERVPFGYHDKDRVRRDLAEAGFEHIAIDSVEKLVPVRSAEHAAIGLCKGTPLRNEIEARDPERLEEATQRAAAAIASCFGNGAFDHSMRAWVVTASRV